MPAYFGLPEREATRNAGRIAGLNVLDILAEPVAAALNYQALDEGDGVRNMFVYHLGGGTFDTTVIPVDGDDIQVICTDGDRHLGGADWDLAICDFYCAALPRSTRSSNHGPTRVYAGSRGLRGAAEDRAQRTVARRTYCGSLVSCGSN